VQEVVSHRDARAEAPAISAARADAAKVDRRAARNKAKPLPADPEEEVDYVTRMRVRSQRLVYRLATHLNLQGGPA
jgi:hypothetical protein